MLMRSYVRTVWVYLRSTVEETVPGGDFVDRMPFFRQNTADGEEILHHFNAAQKIPTIRPPF